MIRVPFFVTRSWRKPDPFRVLRLAGLIVLLATLTGTVACGKISSERQAEPLRLIIGGIEPVWSDAVSSLTSWLDGQKLVPARILPADDDATVGLRLDFVERLAGGTALALEPNQYVVASRWLALPLAYTADRIGYGFSELAELDLLGELRPLEQITAPWRVAPIDQLLPGEPDYPLLQYLIVNASAADEAALTAFRALMDTYLRPEAVSGFVTPERPFVVSAVGDIVIEPPGQAELAGAGWDIAVLLRDVLPYLRSRQLLLGNLEAPVSVRGEGNPVKRFQFRHRPEVLDALVSAGFDYLGFANNHTLDFGPEAFADTLLHLEASSLAWSGAGMNLAEALRPALIDTPAGRLAVFAYADFPVESRGFKPADAAATPDSPGIAVDKQLVRQAVAEAAAAGYIVLVLPHAGFEYVQKPPEAIKRDYRALIEAGAHLVLASHPHVLQGIEVWQNGLIAYSLGNFLFTQLDEPPLAQRSAVFNFVLYKGRFRGYSLVPVRALDDFTELEPDLKRAEADFVALNRLIGE